MFKRLKTTETVETAKWIFIALETAKFSFRCVELRRIETQRYRDIEKGGKWNEMNRALGREGRHMICLTGVPLL